MLAPDENRVARDANLHENQFAPKANRIAGVCIAISGEIAYGGDSKTKRS